MLVIVCISTAMLQVVSKADQVEEADFVDYVNVRC